MIRRNRVTNSHSNDLVRGMSLLRLRLKDGKVTRGPRSYRRYLVHLFALLVHVTSLKTRGNGSSYKQY